MGLKQSFFIAVHGIVSIAFLLVSLVSVYYWYLHWTVGPSAETMGQAGAMTVILIVLLIPVIVLDQYKPEGV